MLGLLVDLLREVCWHSGVYVDIVEYILIFWSTCWPSGVSVDILEYLLTLMVSYVETLFKLTLLVDTGACSHIRSCWHCETSLKVDTVRATSWHYQSYQLTLSELHVDSIRAIRWRFQSCKLKRGVASWQSRNYQLGLLELGVETVETTSWHYRSYQLSLSSMLPVDTARAKICHR